MSTLKVDAIRHNSATSDAITTAADGTCTARITGMTGGGALSHRNLVINGDFRISQRGTSSTSSGFHTVDRFEVEYTGTDEAPTQAQVDVSAGTTPYTNGFRKAFKITNGNQTSGAGASDRVRFRYKVESQDLANSGWNYVSSSSNVTLSFWIKSSVAQNFYGQFLTMDGTQRAYTFETGSLTADTWTKITKTISGDSNITFNNDNGLGLQFDFFAFLGTASTGTMTLNQWGNYNGSARTPDYTSTWYTTNDATLEITGVQLEVGDTATSFEHRSYGEELTRCQRYCQVYVNPRLRGVLGSGSSSDFNRMGMTLLNTLRTDPSATWSGTQSVYGGGGTASITGINSLYVDPYSFEIDGAASGSLTGGTGTAVIAYTGGNEATITLSAEL